MRMLVAFSCLALLAIGCATVPVPPGSAADPPDHEGFASFLARFVDERGRLDYAAAAGDRADLDAYLAWLARVSPDTTPERFRSEPERLAYWINAYNAWTIAAVLDHYPIESVQDVRDSLVFLPDGTGFFLFQRITLGGVRTSLYHLENGVVRARFEDPRIHFALNCASRGCPRLPAEPFRAATLEAQLERETRHFVAEPRNVRIDGDARVLELSSIFAWYESDFTDWPPVPGGPAADSLRDYVAHYLPEAERSRLAACGDCEVAFVPYDWRLNDRRP